MFEWAFGFAILFIFAVIVGINAGERGMNSWGWGIFTFLFVIPTIIVYLIFRKPRVR